MKSSRRLVLLLVGLAFGSAGFAACAFPTVSFDGEDAAADGSVADSKAGDVDVQDASQDGPRADADAGYQDAAILDADPDVAVEDDAGGKVDASDCTTCDCDSDGFNRFEAGVDCGAGPYDCDDRDTRARPNQLFLAEPAEPPMNGNWNCDSTVEKGYPENVNCEGLLLGLNCTKVLGFTTTVACGQTGKFVKCKQVPVLGLPLACGIDSDSVENDKVQPCK